MNEIKQSVVRVKAAKHGQRIEQIVPKHKINYFIPDKRDYLTKRKRMRKALSHQVSPS